MNRLQTTHSWEFLGIDSIHQYNHMPTDSNSNIIVGVIDTGKYSHILISHRILFLFHCQHIISFKLYCAGIWPESNSFNDQGLGPVPKKFKGECVTGERFTLANCNRYQKF